MKRRNKFATAWRMGILGTACLLVLVGSSFAGNSNLTGNRNRLDRFCLASSSMLLEKVALDQTQTANDAQIPVIVKVKKEYLGPDLQNSRQLDESQRNILKGIRSGTGRLTARQIEARVASNQIEYTTQDVWNRPMRSLSLMVCLGPTFSRFEGVYWAD